MIRSPEEARRTTDSRRRIAVAMGTGVACALAIGVAACLDRPVLERLEGARAQFDWAARERLGRLADYADIPSLGWVTPLIALVIYRFDPRGRQRAVALAFSVLAVTLATNAVKLSTGRLRPKAVQKLDGDPAHVWLGPLGGLGDPRARSFPSGHTATAFAHAAALSALYPAAAPAFYALAAPVPVSRVLMRGHFVSDVVAGGFLAFFLTRRLGSSNRFRRLCERVAARLPALARHRRAMASSSAVRTD